MTAPAFRGALGVSYEIDFGGTTIAPGVEARYSKVSFDRVSETGGFAALDIERENFKSFQGRAGVDIKSATVDGVQVHVNGDYVREFEFRASVVPGEFLGGTGPTAGFALDSTDKNWFDVGLGVNFVDGPIRSASAQVQPSAADNAGAQTYSASATLRF